MAIPSELQALWAGVGATLVVAVAAGLWKIGVALSRWRARRLYREELVNDVVGRMKDTRRFLHVLSDWNAGHRNRSLILFPLNSPAAKFWRLVSGPFLNAGASPKELSWFGRFYSAIESLEEWTRLGERPRTEAVGTPDDLASTHAMGLEAAGKEAILWGDIVLKEWGNEAQREASNST